MEDMNFAPKYIDAQTTTSSDGSIEKSIDTPLASKYVLTCFDNEKVVVGDQKGRVCNASNQINYRHRALIPIGVAVVLNAGPKHHQTLGDCNRPDRLYTNRSVIRPPAIQRKDFELKPKYFSLVSQHPFHGLPNENPIDHIKALEDFVSNIKVHGVSEDYLFCKLFPHSLAGDARHWLKQLQPGSLTCWSDIKSVFLKNFFDDARTEEFRNKMIYNFSKALLKLLMLLG